MRDKPLIILGLVIFLILITFPAWYNVINGKATYVPDPVVREGQGDCIADGDWMRANHMDVLNEWRDLVVREGVRVHETEDHRRFNMSLSYTCMDCHSNKEEFCDRCHDYLDVDPYCWECHLEPALMTPGEDH